jgi:hypothetical protein
LSHKVDKNAVPIIQNKKNADGASLDSRVVAVVVMDIFIKM